MVRITYVEPDNSEHSVNVDPDMSLMEGAVFNNIRGIYADCGGDGGCATCHVYVDETWCAALLEMSAKEKSTLRFAYHRTAQSRLSCFIRVEPALEGLIVRVPERQF